MNKVLKNTNINLQISKQIVTYDEEVTVTLIASGQEAKEGLQIPYRILSGQSPFGSDVALIDFTYDTDTDYYYLHVILSEPLGVNILTVEQLSGDLVELEKVSDILYKYKNPLDKYEISRTFRATLKTIQNENDMMKGVRAFDFVYSNEYGFFELDSNLSSTKTFKNKISKLSEIDRVFNLSLYYMPQHSVSALFTNNYTPPTPYPPYVNPTKPKIQVESVFSNVYEGEEASFKISYQHIRKNYQIYYEWVDTTNNLIYSDFLITDETGSVIINIPTSLVENFSSTRYVRLWIKDYPKISAVVYVNAYVDAPVDNYESVFFPGSYTVALQPYSSYSFLLVGGGGAGGGATARPQSSDNFPVDGKGEPGGDTYIIIKDHRISANGGGGGGMGKTIGSSTFIPGAAGYGGDVIISNIENLITITESIKGNAGQYSMTSPALGGVTVAPNLTPEGYDGSGGKAASGYNSQKYGPGGGGGGGSGALVKGVVLNNTSTPLTMKLFVGSQGINFDMTEGKRGFKGLHGFAHVKSI